MGRIDRCLLQILGREKPLVEYESNFEPQAYISERISGGGNPQALRFQSVESTTCTYRIM